MYVYFKQAVLFQKRCAYVLCVSLVQAEYWHDPFNLEEYRKSCIFLPDINQENVSDICNRNTPVSYCCVTCQTFNQDYKDRLSNISNLVLVKFTEDTMVQPKESEVYIERGGGR